MTNVSASTSLRHDSRQPNSRGCFVCGLHNPIGLRLVFYEDREQGQVRAEIVVPESYRGYPGVVHGGIVATILDETAGRAVMLATGDRTVFFVTAKMEMRYRRAAPTDTPLLAVGWVERMAGSRAWVKGELRLRDTADPAAAVLAECRSLIVLPRAEFLERWEEEAPHWRVYSDQELLDNLAIPGL